MAQLDIAGQLAAFHNSLTVDKFRPLHLRYLQYDPQFNNFKLLLDKGDLKNPNNSDLERTSKDLLKYFFVGISLPNDTFWVNLRPDSPDNIIDPLLAQTDVGRIMLEADLELKKDTARATSPETPEGREYWNKLYQKAEELFGSQNVTIPTLTRPWIVPDEIIIRESTDSAYIYKATLKVMLEQDYLKDDAVYNFKDERLKQLNEYSSQLIRETIIPNLNKQINTSKKYAALRQVYYSLILSQWFKARFYGKEGTYSRTIDRKDLTNISSKDSWTKDTYFKAYQKSFKDGEYNVQEPVSTPFGQVIRSYFSGGEIFGFTMPAFGAERVDAKTGCRTVSMPAPAVNNPNADNSHLAGMQVQSTNNPGEVVVKTASVTEGSTSPGYESDLEILKRRWKGKNVLTGREAAREAGRAFAEYVRWFLNKYGPLADSKKLSFKLGMSESEVDELRREMAKTLANPAFVVLPARAEENDFGIAGDNQGGVNRREHERRYNAPVLEIIKEICKELGIKADSEGYYDLRSAVQARGGRIKTSHGEIYITEDGVLVIKDSRIQRSHAGRGELAVYATDDSKVVHELSELRNWIQFAINNGIASREDVSNGLLGTRL